MLPLRAIFAPRRSWLIILLSGLAGLLFNIDRLTLSVLKTTLKKEMAWTDSDYGLMVVIYMVPYAVCYLVVGRIIERWGTRRMMTACFAGMSLACIGSGLSLGVGTLALSRLALGVAQAGIIPTIVVSIVRWFPPEQRGAANTAGKPLTMAGQVVVVPLAAGIAALWGWRWAFLLPGLLGLACAAAWWKTDRPQPASATGRPHAPRRFREVLRSRAVRGVFLARLASDPLWFFLLFWQPGFFQERLGLSLTEYGRYGWIPMAVGMLGTVAGGFLSDALIRRGMTPVRSRVLVLLAATGLAPSFLLLDQTRSMAGVFLLFALIQIMAGIWIGLTPVLVGDLVPENVVGTAVAAMSALGAVTATLMNYLAGPLVAAIGYSPLLRSGAVLYPLAAFFLWRAYWKPRPAGPPAPEPSHGWA